MRTARATTNSRYGESEAAATTSLLGARTGPLRASRWPNVQPQYTCTNQGISRGYADTYAVGLPCQWIDITGVPPGEYTLRISLNHPRADSLLPQLVERDYENNIHEVAVTIP